MIRALCEAILGSVIILAVAYGFLVSSVPHAEAGEGCRGQIVWATWYGKESCQRSPCKTATGRHFDGSQILVAHRSLPFGTKLRISYAGRSIVAPVEDRGPAAWTGNTVDLSRAVAVKLGMISAGRVKVCVERL